MSAQTRPAISAHGLYKAYGAGAAKTPVLHGLDIEIAAGELTLVCGPSGCGKSTLLAILSGLLRPDAGKVALFGAEVDGMSEGKRDRYRLHNVGFVFQGFNLFPALDALEQVQLPLDYLDIRADAARDRARTALEEVGLGDKMHLRPSELSGGEKQRVAIARALAKRPRLLFADEPTSSLDAANGHAVIELLRETARRHGTTVLCVSHDARLIENSDRVLQMEDGRWLRDWRPARALEHGAIA